MPVTSTPAITGIRRSEEYSPAHEDDDWRILKLTADALAAEGQAVELITEEEVGSTAIHSPVVFNMCQGPVANTALLALERAGRLLINRPSSCLNALRINQLTRLGETGVPIPRSYFVDTDGSWRAPAEMAAWPGVWVKRGEVHATEPGDVSFVPGAGDVPAALADLGRRGIARAVVQQHLVGPVVKFYVVAGTPFFEWYAFKGEVPPSLDLERLRQRAEQSARALGLEVYGGECVLTDDGAMPVIDVNDWPSFARFRDQAARVIAGHILSRARAQGAL